MPTFDQYDVISVPFPYTDRAALERIARDTIQALDGLPDEVLNRPLPLPETNSLFALATHLAGAGEFWTLVLVGVAVIISFVLGTFIGMFIAWRHGSFADSVLPPFLNLFSSVPYFWLALILLYVLGFKLNLFPLSGGYDIDLNPGLSGDFIASAVGHAILPALTIVISSMAGWMLGMRNTMITTLTEDYVLMARAKGLSDLKVMYAYAARNAILPNITGFALALGFIVGGALFTEIVFSYPGIGYALMQAVQNADYPLVQGIFLVISMAVLAANLLADLINTALDPRTR